MMNWSRKLTNLYNFTFLKPDKMAERRNFLIAGSNGINENLLHVIDNSLTGFLEEKLNKEMSMFEYGSGKSTLYFANHIKQVISISHDDKHYQKLLKSSKASENLTLRKYGLNRNFANAIVSEGAEKMYDIISVKGRYRAACAINAFAQLTPSGILMLNDSEGENNVQVFEYYQKKGYKHISFASERPFGVVGQTITLFYKKENIFNI